MPYIQTTTNIEITKEQELSLKAKYAQAVQLIGKSQAYLMLGFNDKCSMYFGGEGNEPIAFVEVKCFGKAGGDLCKLTKEICNIIFEELGIAQDKIYVKYEFVENWGWNGSNF